EFGNARQWHADKKEYTDPKNDDGIARQLRANQTGYVDPKNNHCAILYWNAAGELNEHMVSFWDAVQARTRGKDVYALPKDGVKLEAILRENDLFIIDSAASTSDGTPPNIAEMSRERIARCLYRVQKISAQDYYFRLHTESTLDREFSPYLYRVRSFKRWQELRPVKVRLTPTGGVCLP
ncbi:MAG: hypothetical protein ACR2PW_05090, partial [Gammaproteobacteria bacterium]